MKAPILLIAMVCAAVSSAFADVELQFANAAMTAKQGARTITLPVLLYNSGGSEQTVQVSWPTTDGTAKHNVNYRSGSPAIANVNVPAQGQV